MFAFIWAEAKDKVIGADQKMPWHLSDDLQYFKKTTLGHTVVMGRRTFSSFGGRPLPKRQNIVLTHQSDFKADFDNVLVYHDVQEVLDYEKAHAEDWLFIIGGAEIFKCFIPVVQRLYVTKIDASVAGDTYMPDLPTKEFELIQKTVSKVPGLPHAFEVYDRRR